MSFIQPFILGDHLFVELLSTTPPTIIHRTVHLAEDRFSFFRVFKNVNPELGEEARRHSRDLELEAEALEAVNHPRVPELCDFGQVGGHSFLVYRYVWGKSLLHLLRALKAHRKMLSEDYAIHIAHELLRTVNALHAVRAEGFPNGLVHANLNPRDVIISYSGEVHLVNLGRKPPTLQGQATGAQEFRNLSYLAPEQVNRGGLSTRTDLFSVGSMLYEMITGTPPFMEKTAPKVLNRIARCSFQAPAAANPSVSRELNQFLLKALSAYPNDRFSSAGEMAQELDRYLRRRHAGFSADKVRTMMNNLFREDIGQDITFFSRLESEVERQHRPLVRSIAPALLASIGATPAAPGRSFETPEPFGYHTHPGEPSVRGTVTFTFDEFRRQIEPLRTESASFFEVEDTILVPAPREPNIIPIQDGDPRAERRFSTREMASFESTELPAIGEDAPVELSITMEPFDEDEDEGEGEFPVEPGESEERSRPRKGRTSIYEFGDLSGAPFSLAPISPAPALAVAPAPFSDAPPPASTQEDAAAGQDDLADEVDAQLFACSRPLSSNPLPTAETVEAPMPPPTVQVSPPPETPTGPPRLDTGSVAPVLPPPVKEIQATPSPVSPPPGSDPGTAGLVAVRDEREVLIGREIGEYVVTGILGWGGMGTVYGGIQPTIGKEVAIKVLDPNFANNTHMAQRFLAEARAVNSIRNPNIIDIFSFGILENRYHYFVMEKLNGITLGDYIRAQGTVSPAVGHEILMQVLSAVAAAHQKGIIHRDLKPDNIYLERRPFFEHYVKILDFGIAKFNVDGFKTSVTNVGVPIGTPRYMSPEQCKGLTVTEASDLYMLGMILYEMFTGTLPFQKDSYIDMLIAHLNEPPPRPSTRVVMDPELENLILWALEKDPKKRPASALVYGESLLPCLKRLS